MRLGRLPPTQRIPAKPDSLGDLKPRSWLFVFRKTLREFSRDQCTDQAAALTYYAVLAIFPALIAMVSLLGVFGQGPTTVNALMKIVEQVAHRRSSTPCGPRSSN
jgi:membrane protein